MEDKKNKKKKGFTLIELVIVLAVLAIIALIAIPNFTKVRNDSLKKADLESCNQIKKITLMSIANEDITLTSDTQVGTIGFGNDGTSVATPDGINVPSSNTNYKTYLKDVKKPQYKNPNGSAVYNVTITNDGDVTVVSSTMD